MDEGFIQDRPAMYRRLFEEGPVRPAVMPDGTDPAAMGRASEVMTDYLQRLIADKRASSDDDLLAALIRARDEGDRLSETELVAMAFLLLTGGFRDDGQPDWQRSCCPADESGPAGCGEGRSRVAAGGGGGGAAL